jgi:hypothetical protein
MRKLAGLWLGLVLSTAAAHASSPATTENVQGFISEPIVDGRLSPSQRPFVKEFLGHYGATDDALWSPVAGQVLVTLKADGRLAISSTMDITGSHCRASIGPAEWLRAFPDVGSLTLVEVRFKLNKGNCTWIVGRYVTLHYNRALTGADIYQVDVVLRRGRWAFRGRKGKGTQTWDLIKLPPARAIPSA